MNPATSEYGMVNYTVKDAGTGCKKSAESGCKMRELGAPGFRTTET